ncbi:SLC35D [Lepeophtheirus salmonis]|uniref:SLC35D n=1 Tax=Lepeophtheirus salmonis TaxID=72036 RepID=A0A7R8CT08_LEPSM|nr:SLC35D [Lepeophtheirus salmonis]CAF2922089.1 SLC35D [Lepeophtheirus salmonis]
MKRIYIAPPELPEESNCDSTDEDNVGDYDFDILTYTVGALSVLAQGLYLTFVQKKCNSTMSVLDMIFINSWNTLPFFMFTSLILGEPMDIWEKGHTFLDPVFLVSVITLSMAGFLLVYSQFLCTTVCSALTTSLVGVAKSVIQTFVGFFTIGVVKFNIINILGRLYSIPIHLIAK